MTILKSLCAPELTVTTSEDPAFEEAIASKAFQGILQKDLFPDAVLVVKSVAAVQAAVEFCSEHNIRICPRSGGHSWQSIWLQGGGTVILDLGQLNQVTFDAETETVAVGPGATNINQKIPPEYFFPSGHCPGVPVGGFILGGGFGTGFTKYGMSCTLVQGMEVVLASGEVKAVKIDDRDEVAKALFRLVKGSYNLFPAIVTKYVLQAIPTSPCVLSTMYAFKLSEWKKVVTFARDIQHRGDADASAVETTMVLCYAPPPVTEATGQAKMAALSLTVWGDSEEHAHAVLQKYTQNLANEETLVPAAVETVPAKQVPEMLRAFYPEKSRYKVEGFLGDERVHAQTDKQVQDMLEPLVDMWMSSDETTLPPPSHSIVAFAHPSLVQSSGGSSMATGFNMSMLVLALAIYTDDKLDDVIAKTLKDAQAGFHRSASMWTELPEGDIRSLNKPGITATAMEDLKKYVELLDPKGLISDKKTRHWGLNE